MEEIKYEDINKDIRPFLGLTEGVFNSLPHEARESMCQGARVRWLAAGGPKASAMRYSVQHSVTNEDLDELPMDDLTDYYYEHHVKETTLGITDHRFALRDTMYTPTPWQYINMVSHKSTQLGATNATVQYVDNDDMLHNLSFSRDDLRRYTVQELLDILRKGVYEWQDKNLYSGSDYILNAISTYSLAMKHFTITVSRTQGGYGKMIADYYDTLGLENNGHDCLIQCFLHIHSKEHPYAVSPCADHVREVLSQKGKGKLGLEMVPVLEEMFQVEVDVLRDQRILEFKVEHPPMMDMTVRQIKARIKEFRTTVVKDESVVIHGTGNRKWQLLHKDEHYDIVTKTYSAS
ncbi:hypothetical protein GGI11_004363, partial [Coemansia sp. RSA 2049]